MSDIPQETVLWLDGCFDGFHYAHANAIRQAAHMVPGPVRVVVGIHSDAEITRNKGPPLFKQTERYAVVEGCRWVNHVVHDVPYSADMTLLRQYGIDFVVHGDDIAMDACGQDCLAEVKSKGMYKEFKRTEGISTTSLIQRILRPESARPDQRLLRSLLNLFAESIAAPPFIDFGLPDGSKRIPHTEGRIVVHVADSWDCFGAGHVEYLRRAKEALPAHEKPLLVYSDKELMGSTGESPFLSLLERALAVIQCRYTDVIVLNSPRAHDLAQSACISMGINVVVNGDIDSNVKALRAINVAVPELLTQSELRTNVLARREAYETRQRRKGL